MGIIIGAGTIVNFANLGSCVTSVNWGYSPNPQRLYCIGEWSPRFIFNKPTETMSVTIYTGTGISLLYDTTPHLECRAANNPADIVFAEVDAAGCGTGVTSVTGNWYVVGYNFNKDDPLMPGQESWSLQRWATYGTVGQPGYVPAPTYIIRGITEGQSTPLDGTAEYVRTGIRFTGTTVSSPHGAAVQATTGSVSAGGQGRADVTYYGTVDRVGGGESVAGKIGNGSATIPYTPMWL
jgi:hypothetical protein